MNLFVAEALVTVLGKRVKQFICCLRGDIRDGYRLSIWVCKRMFGLVAALLPVQQSIAEIEREV